jgi:hypothetical protein
MTEERKIWPCLYDCNVFDAPERKMRRRLFYLVNLDGGKCSDSTVNNFKFVLKHFLKGKTTYMCHPDPDKFISNEVFILKKHPDITVDVICEKLEKEDKKWGLLHCREIGRAHV